MSRLLEEKPMVQMGDTTVPFSQLIKATRVRILIGARSKSNNYE